MDGCQVPASWLRAAATRRVSNGHHRGFLQAGSVPPVGMLMYTHSLHDTPVGKYSPPLPYRGGPETWEEQGLALGDLVQLGFGADILEHSWLRSDFRKQRLRWILPRVTDRGMPPGTQAGLEDRSRGWGEREAMCSHAGSHRSSGAHVESVPHHLHPRLGQSCALGLAQERGRWGHNFLALLERWLPLIKDDPAEKAAGEREPFSTTPAAVWGQAPLT